VHHHGSILKIQYLRSQGTASASSRMPIPTGVITATAPAQHYAQHLTHRPHSPLRTASGARPQLAQHKRHATSPVHRRSKSVASPSRTACSISAMDRHDTIVHHVHSESPPRSPSKPPKAKTPHKPSHHRSHTSSDHSYSKT
jgi:hypothetical protein